MHNYSLQIPSVTYRTALTCRSQNQFGCFFYKLLSICVCVYLCPFLFVGPIYLRKSAVCHGMCKGWFAVFEPHRSQMSGKKLCLSLAPSLLGYSVPSSLFSLLLYFAPRSSHFIVLMWLSRLNRTDLSNGFVKNTFPSFLEKQFLFLNTQFDLIHLNKLISSVQQMRHRWKSAYKKYFSIVRSKICI